MPADADVLTDALERLVCQAARQVAPDVRRALDRAAAVEPGEAARDVLVALLRKADAGGHALDADTGLVTFFVRAGPRFAGLPHLDAAIREAVARATRHEPLSEFATDCRTGDLRRGNVGDGVPVVHFELAPEGAGCEVDVLLKGAGADRLTTLWELPARVTPEEIGTRLAALVAEAGGRPCPPLILGVGVGGTPEQALMLSRRALLRPVDVASADPTLAAWEAGWLEAVNGTGIGPMGIGGRTTALAVHVQAADRHRAFCPVGVSAACWSDRRAHLRLDEHGAVVGVALTT